MRRGDKRRYVVYVTLQQTRYPAIPHYLHVFGILWICFQETLFHETLDDKEQADCSRENRGARRIVSRHRTERVDEHSGVDGVPDKAVRAGIDEAALSR